MPYAERRTNLFSTDILGLTMDPNEMMQLHDLSVIMHERYQLMVEYFSSLFSGVEAFPLVDVKRFNIFIEEMLRRNLPVVSIHGRTGGLGYDRLDTIFLQACNNLLVDTPTLLDTYGKNFELLFHVPELEDSKNMVALKKHSADPLRFVWVENHHTKASLTAATQKVKMLRSLGIPSAVMFDICHYIGANNLGTDSFNDEYDKALDELAPLFAQTDQNNIHLIQGFHLAAGRKIKDSLPLLNMSVRQLSTLGSMITTNHVNRLVIEHQEGGLLSSVSVPKKTIPMLQQRHAQIIDKLLQTGIL